MMPSQDFTFTAEQKLLRLSPPQPIGRSILRDPAGTIIGEIDDEYVVAILAALNTRERTQ